MTCFLPLTPAQAGVHARISAGYNTRTFPPIDTVAWTPACAGVSED